MPEHQIIELERKHRSVLRAWMVGLAIAIPIGVGVYFSNLYVPGHFSQRLPTPVEAFIGALVMSLVLGIGVTWYDRRHDDRTRICTKCFRAVNAGEATGSCACGGGFEPIDYWEWVEEPKDETSN